MPHLKLIFAAVLSLMTTAAQCGTQLGIATTAQHWPPLGLGQVVDLRNGPEKCFEEN